MAGISSWLEASTRRRLLVGVCALVAVVGAELGVMAGVRAARPDESGTAAPATGEWDDFPAENRATGDELVVLSSDGYSTSVLYSPVGPCLLPGPYVAAAGVTDGCEPLERLFRRDANGVAVRAYQSEESLPPPDCGTAGSCPPPECFPSRYVSAGLSTASAVGSAYGPVYAEPFEPITATSGFFGVAEGDSVAWAVVQIAEEATRVRAEFAAGGTDEMEPADGVAVLASPVDTARGEVPEFGVTVQAFDGDNVVASTEVRGLPAEDQVLSRPECAPRPPELPEPDGPPPADEEAARQAVIDVFTEAYTAVTALEDRVDLVDNPEGIAEASAVVEQNFPGAITPENTVRVEEVRFLNPTTAAVRYTIVLPNYSIPEFPNRVGEAVFVDGRWKVTRETVCHDLALGGASC